MILCITKILPTFMEAYPWRTREMHQRTQQRQQHSIFLLMNRFRLTFIQNTFIFILKSLLHVIFQ